LITPQNGIFAQGTHSHYFVELDLLPGVTPSRALVSLRGLRAPDVTSGGVNFVLAFGADLWRGIAPQQTPPDINAFSDIRGPTGKFAPSRQHDIWLWFHGSTPDVVFDHARNAWLAIRDVAKLAEEQPCFVYRDSRDLTGFVDGTNNPPPLEAPNVALIPPGQAGGGGSHVLVMRWVHDLESFHALPVVDQEHVIGRSKTDSTVLPKEDKHAPGHAAHVSGGVFDEEMQIYRRSVPYGTIAEHGLYFLAFSSKRSRFDHMLAKMFGTDAAGKPDPLMDFSKPVGGAYYFAPSLTTWKSCA
jgi:putative iron-dependent peroxidase